MATASIGTEKGLYSNLLIGPAPTAAERAGFPPVDKSDRRDSTENTTSSTKTSITPIEVVPPPTALPVVPDGTPNRVVALPPRKIATRR